MSIRPVDMQVIVQKTTEVSKTTHIENQRPEMAQQQITTRIQKEAELDEQRVLQTMKSEQEQVDKDGRGAGKRDRKSDRRRDREQEDDKKEKSGTSFFDISI